MRINLDEFLKEDKGIELQLNGVVHRMKAPSIRKVLQMELKLNEMGKGNDLDDIRIFEEVLFLILGKDLSDEILDTVPFTEIGNLMAGLVQQVNGVGGSKDTKGITEDSIELIDGDKKEEVKIPRE